MSEAQRAYPDRTGQTVTVYGNGAVRVEPDEGFLSITLTSVENTPGPALSDVAQRGEALEALLDELTVPKPDRSTTGISVREEVEYGNDGPRTVGHRATATVSVRVRQLDLIGRTIMRATEELDARIGGPAWRVSIDNPARLEAAKLATANARAKAEAFATGVGAQLGGLIELIEPGEDRHGYFIAEAAVRTRSDDGMPVDPGEQSVTALIRATFALVSE